ncbi:MAG: hypothetical protein ABI329_02680, partial [Candidatus Tumulicola sp.]
MIVLSRRGLEAAFATLAFSLALAAVGCAAHPSNAADAADTAVSSPAADAAASPSTAADVGHIHLAGAVKMDRDFSLDACQIAPAGDGLLSG